MAILYAPHAPYQPSYNPPHIRMSLASNHACVVCDDPELAPLSSPEPPTFASQPPPLLRDVYGVKRLTVRFEPRPGFVYGVVYQHPPANSRSSTP